MKNPLPFLFLILFVGLDFCFAQKAPFKIGKVSEEELLLEKCDFYPDAHSMILAEYGKLDFVYNDDKGFQYQMEVSVRKKIFKITDADQGNVKIRLYEPAKGSSKEEISSLKSYTYNLVDGKVEKEKLDNKEYYTKRLNDYWVEISFAIPNIKDGTVIEYAYTKTSDYLMNLSTWYFQNDIPTAHSEFRYTIPEYFNYQTSQLGNVYHGETENDIHRETFTYSWETHGALGKVSRGKDTFTSNSKYTRFVLNNIPPMEDEPYMNNKSDVPSRLEFQLVSTNFPNSTMEIVAGNYTKFNQEMISHSALGDRLKNGNFTKDFQNKISGTSLEKAGQVYEQISNHFNWNKIYTYLSPDAGRPAYNSGEGNVADINLTLTAALRVFGIIAYPVILSTRGSGTVHPIYPSHDDFNYVITAVAIDDVIYLCDATSKLPFGQLPLRCRNGNGWLIKENGGQWINLKSNSTYEEVTVLNSEINENQLITHVSQKEVGYAAHKAISEIGKNSVEEFSKNISARFTDAELQNFKISETTYSQPLNIEYDIVKENTDANILYIQPIMLGTLLENPFKREERISPIDFPYGQSYKVISTFTIPDGYTVELPEAAIIKLPEDHATFMYSTSQLGNKINIVSNLQVTKTDFSTLDYPNLKKFYQLVAEKNQEPIVISR